jgi:hypothetical protein
MESLQRSRIDDGHFRQYRRAFLFRWRRDAHGAMTLNAARALCSVGPSPTSRSRADRRSVRRAC